MRQVSSGTLVFCGWMLLAAPARAQDDPKAIIEKAIKAHGGAEKLARADNMKTKGKGTMDFMGLSVAVQVESVSQMPDKLKSQLQLDIMGQQISVVQIYNGEKGWVVAMGMTQELTGPLLEEVKQAVHAKRVENLLALQKDKSFELSPLAEIKIDGKPAVGVKVVSKGMRDSSLYFDKETGLLVRSIRKMLDFTQQEVEGETTYTNFKDFDGVKLATKSTVQQGGKKFLEAEVNEVKFVEKVDPSEFAKP